VKKIKILHVVNIPFVIPYFLGDQINYFNDNGYEVHIACSQDKNIFYYSQRWNFKFLSLDITRNFSIVKDLKSLIILILYIKNNKIDIVVGHTPKGALLASISSFLNQTRKRIYFRHGLMYETSFGIKRQVLILIEKFTSILVNEVICVSKSVLEKSAELNLSNPNKISIISSGTCNGVDTEFKFNKSKLDKIQIEQTRKKLNVSSDNTIVGFVGRISKDKGINVLVDAWIKLLNTNLYNNITLVLCGPYDSRDPIDVRTRDIIKNEETIIHVGEVENTEYYYNIFDIFVLPSYREGFPTVVLEASSMMLPIITTKSTGCIDSIIENETGIFSEINSTNISDKIQYYIQNPIISNLHGINGREFVKKNFSQMVIWNNLLQNLYR
jgi:glycosyltransferase involved in cell wall biosynthesis